MKPLIKFKSTITPIDAGYGLVTADTLVATTCDEWITPPGKPLTIAGKPMTGAMADLNLAPGSYDGTLGDQPVKVILADPGRVVRRFGARCGSLEYNRAAVVGKDKQAPWETLWKTGPCPDIVVDFDGPYKFVFWRGMSYAPSWCANNVMTSLFFGETLQPGVFRDCCEMMSDRECRYTHARVIHNSPARVVVHWRYALADSAYSICRNQWADELFYIYPDGVAVRSVTIHLDPNDEKVWHVCPGTGRRIPCNMIQHPPGKFTYNDMEFITVNPPGATSDEVTPLDALTLLDTDQYSRTFRWPDHGAEKLLEADLPKTGGYIFRMNYKDRPGVFVATPGQGRKVCLAANTGVRYEAGALAQDDRWVSVGKLPTNFADYIHWPITRGYGTTPLTDPAVYRERPTHTFLGHANTDPYSVAENGSTTWVWFCGMAPQNETALRARVKTWTQPNAVGNAEYLTLEAAYQVLDSAKPLVVAHDRALVFPTFLIPNVWAENARLFVNGQAMNAEQYAVGIESTLDFFQTVITVRSEIPAGSEIRFELKET